MTVILTIEFSIPGGQLYIVRKYFLHSTQKEEKYFHMTNLFPDKCGYLTEN